MTKSTILFVLFIPMWFTVFAQFGKSQYVSRDPRVDKLVERQKEINRLAMKGRIVLEQGYRLMIISTNSRDQALEAKAKLIRNHPDQKSYMSYQSPNFKVFFGNYRNYREAEQSRKELKPVFGENILILPAQVEVRLDRQDSENQP